MGLLTGCGSGNSGSSADPGPPVTAQPQASALLAAVRMRFGNPPRLALVTLRGDGSGLKVVIDAPVGDLRRIEGPAWSPDGRKIYFVGSGNERHGENYVYYESDAFVVDAAGGRPQQLTTMHDVGGVLPTPDGKNLVLARLEEPGRFPGTLSIWIADANGGHARRLLDSKKGQLDFPGSWSPDGKTLVFTRCTFPVPDQNGLVPNTCGVYTSSFDGQDVRKLAGRSRSPSFSADGRHIAFVSDRDKSGKFRTGEDEEEFASELYVMDVDGTHPERLTKSAALAEDGPVWSPDGSRIAYSREGPSSFVSQLMTLNPDGTCEAVMIGDGSQHGADLVTFDSPVWRPGRVTGTAPGTCPPS